MKKLFIYSFFMKFTNIDDYVDKLLCNLVENNDLIVVCSGVDNDEGLDIFHKYTKNIILSKNKKFNAEAYRDGINLVGWAKLMEYNQIILFNHELFGPIYPLHEMFKKMSEKEFDFWGITKHSELDGNFISDNLHHNIATPYIHDSFIVYNENFLHQQKLREYWDQLPNFNSLDEMQEKHESYFTKHFQEMGFKCGAYVNIEKEELFDYKLIVEKYRCPLLKKSYFLQNYDFRLAVTTGESTIELLKFLKDYTEYDTNLILQNIIKNNHQEDFMKNFAQSYILSTVMNTKKYNSRKCKVALILHLFYMDLLEDTIKYVSSIPENIDIYISTQTKENQQKITEKFEKLPNKIEIRIKNNRGRDVSSLLVCFADIIEKYDYACFYHDKKTMQVKPYSVGKSFSYKLAINTLASREFVENIIDAFEENPLLGVLIPPYPNHACYNFTLNDAWTDNFEGTLSLAKRLNLNVPISKNKMPMAPLGSVFWFRCRAMKKLFDYGWKYADFPKEPMSVDGTISHAIERIHSFVAQDAGYYTAFVLADIFANIELTNLKHYLQNYNGLAEEFKIRGTNYDSVGAIRSMLEKNLELVQEYKRYQNYVNNVIMPQIPLKSQKKATKSNLYRNFLGKILFKNKKLLSTDEENYKPFVAHENGHIKCMNRIENITNIDMTKNINFYVDTFVINQDGIIIDGWAFLENKITDKQQVYIQITDQLGEMYTYETHQSIRGDIGMHFNDERYNYSGFSTQINDDIALEGAKIFIIIENDGYFISSDINYEKEKSCYLSSTNIEEVQLQDEIEKRTGDHKNE